MDPLHRRRFLTAAFVSALACANPGEVRAEGDAGTAAKLPLHLFQDVDATGATEVLRPRWMGSRAYTSCDFAWGEGALHGSNCVRIDQKTGARWGSLVWQKPGATQAFNLTGVSRIKFWARGEKGGEKVDFKFSVFPETRVVRMSGPMVLRSVQLTNEWTAYSINLENRNLGEVKLGVVLSVVCPEQDATIFLDSISLE